MLLAVAVIRVGRSKGYRKTKDVHVDVCNHLDDGALIMVTGVFMTTRAVVPMRSATFCVGVADARGNDSSKQYRQRQQHAKTTLDFSLRHQYLGIEVDERYRYSTLLRKLGLVRYAQCDGCTGATDASAAERPAAARWVRRSSVLSAVSMG